MRLVPALALMSSAFALAACAGGGGGDALFAAKIGSVSYCNPLSGVDTTTDTSRCKTTTTSTTTPTTGTDADNDGIPDNAGGGDTDGNTGSGAGGNTTGLSSGNRTIALQKFVYDEATTAENALSIVTSSVSPTFNGTAADILSTNKPTSILYEIDTKSAANSQWSVPATMNEYAFGTRDLRWMALGHSTTDGATIAANLRDENNNPLVFDAARRRLYYTVADPGGDFGVGDEVDHTSNFYWNQLRPYMDARANGGTGTDYREYRRLSTAQNRDELLQVWAWDNSYAMQYQNAIGGGEPKHQAWSFGGNKSATMPTGGSATYAGRFVGTAKTDQWVKPDDAEIDPNALWMVEGRSNFNADFSNSAIRGTLTPESWTSYQPERTGLYTWFTSAADNPSTGTVLEPDYKIIYGTKVTIDGTITSDGTTTTSPTGVVTPVKNVFNGTANLTGTYISGDNPVYGGFFGTNGQELTGVFNVDGLNPNPQGGSTGINDNRRGVLIMNGAFNATCTPGVTCAP